MEIVGAGRKRKCYHDEKHSVNKGDTVLEVSVKDGLSPHGYCQACAAKMIAQARTDLAQLEISLNASGETQSAIEV